MDVAESCDLFFLCMNIYVICAYVYIFVDSPRTTRHGTRTWLMDVCVILRGQ